MCLTALRPEILLETAARCGQVRDKDLREVGSVPALLHPNLCSRALLGSGSRPPFPSPSAPSCGLWPQAFPPLDVRLSISLLRLLKWWRDGGQADEAGTQCGAVGESAGEGRRKLYVESPGLEIRGGMPVVVSQGFLSVVCPQDPIGLGEVAEEGTVCPFMVLELVAHH